MQYKIIERDNPLAVHGLFDSLMRAEHHLHINIPIYVRRGYFMDKRLTAGDFIIVDKDGNIVKN